METNMTNTRKVTCHLLDIAEQGVLSWEGIARECMAYMSEDDVADMARVAEWLPAEDEGEEETETV